MMLMAQEKKLYVDYDEAPSAISDHAYEPRGAWYTVCRICNLAEAAHTETTLDWRDRIAEYDDD